MPSPKEIEELGSKLIGPLPAALIEITGGRVVEAKPEYNHWELTVRVHVISGHANRNVEGRLQVDDSEGRETTDDPGIDVMLHHASEQLHFQPPATKAGGIQIEGISHGMDRANWSWWALDTTVEYRQTINRHRAKPLIDGIDASHGVTPDKDAIEHERLF